MSRNFAGNSCLHAEPNTPVSSRALYLLELLSMVPATKLLQSWMVVKEFTKSYQCKCMNVSSKLTWRTFLSLLLSAETNSSTDTYHRRKIFQVSLVYNCILLLFYEEVQIKRPEHKPLYHHPCFKTKLWPLPLDEMGIGCQHLILSQGRRDGAIHV